MKINIIPATINDIATIQNIALPTWEATYRDILSEEQFEYMLDMMYSEDALAKQLTDRKQVFLLAYEGDSPLGFVSFEMEDEAVKLHKLYVHPQQQGKKIGEILVREVEQRACKAGKKSVQLNVNRYNKALNFYKRQGFEVVDEVDVEIGNGYLMEDYVLEKIVK